MTLRRFCWLFGFLVATLLVAHPGVARADDWDDDDDDAGTKTALSGFIRSDVRFSVPLMNPWWRGRAPAAGESIWLHRFRGNVREPKKGFSRNENALRLRFSVKSGDYKGVAEVDFVFIGFSRKLDDLDGLVDRAKVDPFRIEAHALYFDVTDFLTKGLDLRIGRQIVTWGRADQFNPTSNINPLDLEDALLFGDRLANNMVRFDYNPKGDWILTLVWVPIFRPYLLTSHSFLGPKSIDRVPISDRRPYDARIRRNLHVSRDLFHGFFGAETIVTTALPQLPKLQMENSQVAFKLAGKVKKMDWSISYYYGRFGIPTPIVNRTFNKGTFIDAQATLAYPRMHVVGFDWAGQIPLGKAGGGGRGIGFWVELAVFFPGRMDFAIYQQDFPIVPDGEFEYDGTTIAVGRRPLVVERQPFAKWVVGFDYSFSRHVYGNIQWLHGFVDEFGAGDWMYRSMVPTRGYLDLDTNNDGTDDLNALLQCVDLNTGNARGDHCAKEFLRPRIGDYLVMGFDFKFWRDQMLLRLFLILDMTGMYVEECVDNCAFDPANPIPTRKRTYHHAFSKKGFSMVLFPSLTWSIGSGAEIQVGAFWMIGKRHTKFGDTTTGGSVVFGKGKFSF